MSHFGIFRFREAIAGDYDGNGLVIAFLESIELFLGSPQNSEKIVR